MKPSKRKFSYAERYAIWHCNGQRCWWCKVPLRLVEVTVDHVLPEALLRDDRARQAVLAEYGLATDFEINSYENWLPCHDHCNKSKGKTKPAFVPGNKAILDLLKQRAPRTAEVTRSVSSNVARDQVFKTIFAALEQRTISMRELNDLLTAFVENPVNAGVPEDVIILDSGYWIPRAEIVREGICVCERKTCVGSRGKVYCYFQSSLPSWVVSTGLFWKCYDEFVTCRRCGLEHKRGHIGRVDICGEPYVNQASQSDESPGSGSDSDAA
ncbi:MAG TPA: hypothetical protein VHX14_11520 [Thermoanaerobaculia bacterium]|nr:hypothetical protein [Thermoanaerobaculia bacterium]